MKPEENIVNLSHTWSQLSKKKIVRGGPKYMVLLVTWQSDDVRRLQLGLQKVTFCSNTISHFFTFSS